MITPILTENQWAPTLATLPTWQPSLAPTIVIVPHPDDETLAAGGLIAHLASQAVDITIIAVTDGEHAYTENTGLAAIRRREQTAALAHLGVPAAKILRLALTDSSVTAQQDRLTTALHPLITQNTQILAPHIHDFHPDHEACGRVARTLAHATGATLLSYFFWTWHRGTLATLQHQDLHTFPLTPQLLTTKLEALACHASQLHHAPEPEILPGNLLWPARLPFEVFAL